MKKDFDNWNVKKQQLDALTHRPPHVSEWDLWGASIGENIGSEVGGKSTLFSRPVIIFHKLAHSFYFVIPTTTKLHEGSWYVSLRHRGTEMVGSLHQARATDHRRLSTKLGQLDDSDVAKLREGFRKLYVENNIPHQRRGRGKIPNVN